MLVYSRTFESIAFNYLSCNARSRIWAEVSLHVDEIRKEIRLLKTRQSLCVLKRTQIFCTQQFRNPLRGLVGRDKFTWNLLD